jgi:hypothetical protein
MTTPPQLTSEEALDLLRRKAQADLDDFAKGAATR